MNENTQKEIENLRRQISQQEKMASLGLLSAGIAHEIQNPLNFVINFSKVSQKLLKDMQEVLDELGNALPEDSVEEIKEIMSDLEGNMSKIEENGNRACTWYPALFAWQRRRIYPNRPATADQRIYMAFLPCCQSE